MKNKNILCLAVSVLLAAFIQADEDSAPLPTIDLLPDSPGASIRIVPNQPKEGSAASNIVDPLIGEDGRRIVWTFSCGDSDGSLSFILSPVPVADFSAMAASYELVLTITGKLVQGDLPQITLNPRGQQQGFIHLKISQVLDASTLQTFFSETGVTEPVTVRIPLSSFFEGEEIPAVGLRSMKVATRWNNPHEGSLTFLGIALEPAQGSLEFTDAAPEPGAVAEDEGEQDEGNEGEE